MNLQAISYSARGATYTGYLADGARGVRAPGVLVAHEGGGLTDHVKERAAMLAELGCVAFAMDIFGEPPPDLQRGKILLRALRADLQELRGRARAALAVLEHHAHVDPRRLSAIGFCFGGTAMLELARDGADLAAIVGFHAGLDTTRPQDAVAIRGKVLVCLGADDPIVHAEQRAAFATEMTAAGVDWQMHLYGGVGHSFTNREIDSYNYPGFRYHAEADRRSWRAMRDLFQDLWGGDVKC